MAAGSDKPPSSFSLETSRFLVNEVLFYVSTWLSVVPFDLLVDICTNFYTEEEISVAKCLLFEATATRNGATRLISRRNGTKQKKVADMEDLLREILAADGDEDCQLPMFLAFDGRRLPNQVEGVKVSNEVLNCELKSLTAKVDEIQTFLLRNTMERNCHKTDTVPKTIEDSRIPKIVNIPTLPLGLKSTESPPTFADVVRENVAKEPLKQTIATEQQSLVDGDGFTTVTSRRTKRHVRKAASVVGTKSNSAGPRGVPAAPRFCWLYVGRCEPGTTVESISTGLQEEGINVIQGQCLTSNDHYSSFKIKISLEQKSKAMQPAVWGEGICVRQFYFNRNSVNSVKPTLEVNLVSVPVNEGDASV